MRVFLRGGNGISWALLTVLCVGGSVRAAKPIYPERLAIGKNADGRLELFAVNGEGELQHRWQKRVVGDWSAWTTLARGVLPGIALATGSDGKQVLFAVDSSDHSVKWMRQLTTNSPDWSGWTVLGESVRPPLAVVRNAEGCLELFAASATGSGLRHIAQTNASGAWSEWVDSPGPVGASLSAIRDNEGKLDLFTLAPADGHLLHRMRNGSPFSSDWSSWEDLGGGILPEFVVAQNARGMVEVFGMKSDGTLQRSCREPGSAKWKAWEQVGSQLRPGFAIGQSADARLELFAVESATNGLLHRWEMLPDGSDQWSIWASMERTALPYPGVEQNEDGNLEVFAMDPETPSLINHRRQISKASGWLDWTSLDQPVFEYSSRTWQVDEGLPSDIVQAIAQAGDGYLWIGTRNGLARFDGVAFSAFDEPGAGLNNVSISALCADHSGNLWIGTEGEGLFRLNQDQLTRFTGTNEGPGLHVKVVCEARDGSIWIGTTNGLSRYFQGKFTRYTSREGLLSDTVSYIYEDRDRNLWVATGAGLNRLRGQTMDSFKMPNNLPNDSVRGICQDRGGRIWIGSNNGMLWYNSYWAKSFFAYNTRYGLSDSFVSAIREDSEGNLWVGTYSGLNRFREGRFFPVLNNEGVPFDRVNTLFEDREGNLWVGSVEGLVRLTPKRFATYTKKAGLSHNNITSVLEDRSGSLWAGTWGGGLNRLKEEKVQCFTSSNGLPSDLILALCETKDGSIWAGADFGGGLARIKDDRITKFGPRNGLPGGAIRVLCPDGSTNLWVGTTEGLGRFSNGRYTPVRSGAAIRAICRDSAGAFWFGSDSGLLRLEAGKFTTFGSSNGLSDGRVNALYADREHNLWIGTAAGGLNRYTAAGDFKSYTTAAGLFSDQILDIADDEQGWLWLTCEKGIFRVRKSELDEVDQGRRRSVACLAYGQTDGIESPHCNGLAKPSATRGADGRLWFVTSKGLTTIYPATALVNTNAPDVFVEQVLADKKAVFDPPPLMPNRVQRAPLRVPPGRGELEFRYTALSFQAPESCRFKYKLEGVDSEWVEAGNRRTAHYNNVYPGHYRFLVAACNKDGIWNTAGASLSLELVPYPWQTWWWRALMVAALAAVAGGAARYVTVRRMQREMERLEQRHAIERERGRIAKDIHDDLGSSLTRIMMLGERAEEGLESDEDVAPHVRKIVSSARNTVQSLDEIVWAVNPENDTLEGLVEYISHYANEFFENTPVNCRLEIPVQLPQFMLPAEFRHDLFLVVKEAFNNILKHAQASSVIFRLTVLGTRLQVVIEDDGCGLESNGTGRRGNGLANMRKRTNSLGGELSLGSRSGGGTRVEIAAQLPPSQDN